MCTDGPGRSRPCPRINHIEQRRAIAIRVNPPADLPLQTAMRRIEQEMSAPLHRRKALGPKESIRLAGTADKLATTRQAIQGNFVLALMITFLLMAALKL
jgi:HAE1 family hydrophobic/amphiphilic exporter-1